MAFTIWRLNVFRGAWRILTHVFDLLVFALFMFFTEGPSSPFFVFFVFSLVCATLRWKWRGVLWTAGAGLVTVIAMVFYPASLLRDHAFELNRFIIRIAYLAVVAVLLGYLGMHEKRLRGKLSGLAAWSRSFSTELSALVRGLMGHAAEILEAPRMVMTWEEKEEPWLHLATWSSGQFECTREPPGRFGAMVAEPLAGASFICSDVTAPAPVTLYAYSSAFERWQGSVVSRELQTCFAMRAVLSLTLEAERVKGRLFVLDKHGMTTDDLVLGKIVARYVAVHLDEFYLLEELREVAAMDERIRMARDLHDGLLQSLTAAALQLETTQRLLENDPQTAEQRLQGVQQLIAAEQRDLRSLIQEMKAEPSAPLTTSSDLAERLHELGERLERHWGLRVQMKVRRRETQIADSLAQEIYFILQEALVNAARHASASTVQAEVDAGEVQVRIAVTDDGRGFSFRGRYDHGALAALDLGPKNLRERVAAQGGSLAVESSASGARLEITLPLKPNGEE